MTSDGLSDGKLSQCFRLETAQVLAFSLPLFARYEADFDFLLRFINQTGFASAISADARLAMMADGDGNAAAAESDGCRAQTVTEVMNNNISVFLS